MNDNTTPSPLLDVSEAAAYARTTELVITRAYRAGLLEVSRHIKKPMFRREWLDEWINNSSQPVLAKGRRVTEVDL